MPSTLVKLMVMFFTNCVQTAGFWSRFGVSGQLSQASPIVSKSLSLWSWFVTVGQLSQTSPNVSPSEFS